LLRLEVPYHKGSRLTQYIRDKQPLLGSDKVLWKNLVLVGKYALAIELLKHALYRDKSFQARGLIQHRQQLEDLDDHDPAALLSWIDSL
jgi:hypothetical protein